MSSYYKEVTCFHVLVFFFKPRNTFDDGVKYECVFFSKFVVNILVIVKELKTQRTTFLLNIGQLARLVPLVLAYM